MDEEASDEDCCVVVGGNHHRAAAGWSQRHQRNSEGAVTVYGSSFFLKLEGGMGWERAPRGGITWKAGSDICGCDRILVGYPLNAILFCESLKISRILVAPRDHQSTEPACSCSGLPPIGARSADL